MSDRAASEEGDGFPKGCAQPVGDDVVQVLMSENMARRFEARCLGGHTRGDTYLAGPVRFSKDDLPTYIIGTRGERA